MTASQQQHVRIDELPADQLQGLGKQIEKELDRLQQSASILSNLATEYQVSNNAVEEIGRLQDGQQMMVPLTDSLYVSGQVHEKDKILVELGAGYYAERTPDEASDFCKRKVKHVKKQLDELGEEIKNKHNAMQQINMVLQQKQLEGQPVGTQPDGV